MLSPLGTLTLDHLLSPTKWQTAYAQSEFELAEAQTIEFRLTTSDPVKVWVDGQLALQSRTIERAVLDNVKVNAFLKAGVHRIL